MKLQIYLIFVQVSAVLAVYKKIASGSHAPVLVLKAPDDIILCVKNFVPLQNSINIAL